MQSKLIYTFCIWLTTLLYCHPPPLHLWSPVTSSRRVGRWQWQSVLSRDTHHTRHGASGAGARDLKVDTATSANDLRGMRGPSCWCPSLWLSGLLLVQVIDKYSVHWKLMGFVTGPSSGELLGSTKSMTSVSEAETTALWMLSPGQTARNVDSKGVLRYEIF